MNELDKNLIPSQIKVEGVIFDFDGVIVDSLPAHLEAWKLATHEIIGKKIKDSQRLIGLSTHVIANLIVKDLGSVDQSADLIAAKNRILLGGELEIPLMPGAREFMLYLQLHNIPFGIASNAPPEFVKAVTAYWKLPAKVILGRGDAPRNKPHPDIFMKCARDLSLGMYKQKNTLIFEDSLHGLCAAKRSNMVPIGITSQHTSAELQKSGAEFSIPDLKYFMENIEIIK
jgi:beta-phosphoglucomutase